MELGLGRRGEDKGGRLGSCNLDSRGEGGGEVGKLDIGLARGAGGVILDSGGGWGDGGWEAGSWTREARERGTDVAKLDLGLERRGKGTEVGKFDLWAREKEGGRMLGSWVFDFKGEGGGVERRGWGVGVLDPRGEGVGWGWNVGYWAREESEGEWG